MTVDEMRHIQTRYQQILESCYAIRKKVGEIEEKTRAEAVDSLDAVVSKEAMAISTRNMQRLEAAMRSFEL
jgi:hypothetical protein